MILLRLGSLPKTGLTIMWVLFLFQVIKMFPKMKVDERNAALNVMLVRFLSRACLTELNLKICYLDFRYSYTLALLYLVVI